MHIQALVVDVPPLLYSWCQGDGIGRHPASRCWLPATSVSLYLSLRVARFCWLPFGRRFYRRSVLRPATCVSFGGGSINVELGKFADKKFLNATCWLRSERGLKTERKPQTLITICSLPGNYMTVIDSISDNYREIICKSSRNSYEIITQ